MESSVSVSYLLREAKTVAARIGLMGASVWMDLELNGYPSVDGLPNYRHVHVRIMFFNPLAGWLPVHFEREDLQQALCNQYVFDGIGVIEGIVATLNAEGGSIGRTLPHEVESFIRNQMPVKTQIQAHIDKSAFHGIIDAVRNRVLDWGLTLEVDGYAAVSGDVSEEQLELVAEKSVSFRANTMHVVNIEHASGNATVNVTQLGQMTTIERQVIADNITVIQNHLGEVPEAEREEVAEQLAIVDEEMKSESPRKSRVVGALKAIGRVASSLGASAAKTALEVAVKAGMKAFMGG
jgi:hypothetical protein